MGRRRRLRQGRGPHGRGEGRAGTGIRHCRSDRWRGKTLTSRTPAVDAFACNEVRLLVPCLACEIMPIARRAMATATGTGWSLRQPARGGAAGRRVVADLGSADDTDPLLGRGTLLVRPVAKDPRAALVRPMTPAAQKDTAKADNAHGRGYVMHREWRIAAHERNFPKIADPR